MVNYREVIKDLLLKTTYQVSDDCELLLRESVNKEEPGSPARMMLETIIENIDLAKANKQPLCQSPGYLTVYVTFGEKFFIPELEEILAGVVVEATKAGFCRPSIVDPLTRKNHGDNSGYRVPNIEYEFRKGIDYIQVVPSFKGCGVELCNRMKVFTIAEIGPQYEGIKRFILEAMSDAGGKCCLPVAIGVGIGGQMDVAAKLSRRAISLRGWMERNETGYIANLEQELLREINSLNIGSGGIGGKVTAVAINIETGYTHTAICPVAVNFHCWVARRAGIRIYMDGHIEEMSFISPPK